MPSYTYRAKQGPERTVEGELKADSETGALAAIEAMGLSPLWIREKTRASGGRRAVWLRGVGRGDVLLFTRELASLLAGGVPILRALATVAEQSENERMRRMVEGMATSVRGGSTFSGALEKHPATFSELYLGMVKAGESAGALDRVLVRLAETLEKEEELRRKVQAAIAYPALILGVGAATVFVLLAFFLPRVVALFRGQKDLPWPTRSLMIASDFASGNWHWLLLLVVLGAAVFHRLSGLEKGRRFVDRIKLHLPLWRRFITGADVARFARTLALLLEAGIPVNAALVLAGNTLRNAVLRDEVEAVRRGTVQRGNPISAGLRSSRYLPLMLANLAAVGEESGRLEESLVEVAQFYEKQVEQQGRLATALLEPVLILVVGGVVGFIVAAMLLPIFRLSAGL